MNTTATAPLQAESFQSAAITPADFYRTFDAYSGKSFDRGTLRHIRAALDGQPVAVFRTRELSKIGARLDGSATSASGTSGEVITTAYRSERTGDMVEQGTITPWRDIAAIIPMGENATTAKWAAIRTYMDEASGAIEYAKQQLDIEGAKREHGVKWERWTATPGEYTISVHCWEVRGASTGRLLGHLEVNIADAEAALAARRA